MIPIQKSEKLIACTPFKGRTPEETKEIRNGKYWHDVANAVRALDCSPEYVYAPEHSGKGRRKRAVQFASGRLLYLHVNPRRWEGEWTPPGHKTLEDAAIGRIRTHLEKWREAIDSAGVECDVRLFVNDEHWVVTPETEWPMIEFNWRLYSAFRELFPKGHADWFAAHRVRSGAPQIVPDWTPSRTAMPVLYNHSPDLSRSEYNDTSLRAMAEFGELSLNAQVCMHGGFVWPGPDFGGGRKLWVDRQDDKAGAMLVNYQGRLTAGDEICTLKFFRLLEDRSRVLLNAFIKGRNATVEPKRGGFFVGDCLGLGDKPSGIAEIPEDQTDGDGTPYGCRGARGDEAAPPLAGGTHAGPDGGAHRRAFGSEACCDARSGLPGLAGAAVFGGGQ